MPDRDDDRPVLHEFSEVQRSGPGIARHITSGNQTAVIASHIVRPQPGRR
jgi:hypothetical protein